MMEKIIQELLTECKAIFIEFSKGTDTILYTETFGQYPSSVLINHYRKYSENFELQTPLASWILHKDLTLEQTNIEVSPMFEPQSKMYFSQANFYFNINILNNTSHLIIHMGKRYTRCFLYDISTKNNTVSLLNKKLIWVS